MTRDTLAPGVERAGPVLTRALRRVAPQRMWPVRGVKEVPHEVFAAQVLHALSRFDRLAIAGVTPETLAAAITSLAHGRCCWDAPEDARAILAALTTPVSDDTEGAG